MSRIRLLACERLERRATPTVFVGIPDNLVAQPGGEVIAPVSIDNAAGVRGAEIRLRYDTALLDTTNADVQAGSVWPGSEVVANVDDAAGTIAVFVFGPESLPPGAGTLLNVRFMVAASATSGGNTRLDLEEVLLNEGAILPNPEPQPGNDPTDGLITFVSPGSAGRISGTVFGDTNRNNQPDAFEAVPAVVIVLENRTSGENRQAVTDDEGRYEFIDLPAGDYEIREQQPVALIDGGTNQLLVSLTSGQSLTNQNFRELGLRAEFILNRLQTTTVLPVGSAVWQTTTREIIVAAESSANSSEVAPINALMPQFDTQTSSFGSPTASPSSPLTALVSPAWTTTKAPASPDSPFDAESFGEGASTDVLADPTNWGNYREDQVLTTLSEPSNDRWLSVTAVLRQEPIFTLLPPQDTHSPMSDAIPIPPYSLFDAELTRVQNTDSLLAETESWWETDF